MPGRATHDLHSEEESSLFDLHLPRWQCERWGAELTSAKVGGYVLQLVYLSDRFPPSEVKDQHPVARWDVLEPAEQKKKNTKSQWEKNMTNVVCTPLW